MKRGPEIALNTWNVYQHSTQPILNDKDNTQKFIQLSQKKDVRFQIKDVRFQIKDVRYLSLRLRHSLIDTCYQPAI